MTIDYWTDELVKLLAVQKAKFPSNILTTLHQRPSIPSFKPFFLVFFFDPAAVRRSNQR